MKTVFTGLDFGDLLQIAFIVLKLINQIDWSWWWVLSPMWISLILCIIFGLGKDKPTEEDIQAQIDDLYKQLQRVKDKVF